MSPEKKKRIRVVYPTKDVIWYWGKQTQAHARNRQGSVFFSGAILYSYGSHFPLARHIGNAKHNAVLINGRNTTKTTKKHRSFVREMLRYYLKVPSFEVESIWAEHEGIYLYLKGCVENQKEMVLKARSNWQWHHAGLTDAVNVANDYSRMFMPGKVKKLDAFNFVDYDTLKTKHEENAKRNNKRKLARFWAGAKNIFIPGDVYLRLRPLRPMECHPWVETTGGFGFYSSDFRKLFPILKTLGCMYQSPREFDECLRLGGYAVKEINRDKRLTLKGFYANKDEHVIQGEEVMKLVELLEKGDESKKLPKPKSRRQFSEVLEAVF